MDKKKFGYYVFGGLLIGAIFGSGIGSANGSALAGIGVGALVGVFFRMVHCRGCYRDRQEKGR